MGQDSISGCEGVSRAHSPRCRAAAHSPHSQARTEQSASGGVGLVAALEAAGIRGSLREQATALEHSAPPAAPSERRTSFHRRLPSDPSLPEYELAAARSGSEDFAAES